MGCIAYNSSIDVNYDRNNMQVSDLVNRMFSSNVETKQSIEMFLRTTVTLWFSWLRCQGDWINLSDVKVPLNLFDPEKGNPNARPYSGWRVNMPCRLNSNALCSGTSCCKSYLSFTNDNVWTMFDPFSLVETSGASVMA